MAKKEMALRSMEWRFFIGNCLGFDGRDNKIVLEPLETDNRQDTQSSCMAGVDNDEGEISYIC
jgi:hypothetical protein